MLSTYKKALKHELVKSGFWAAGERAVGKREFRMFMRYLTEGTFKEYKSSLLSNQRTAKSSKHKKYNGLNVCMLACFTSVDFAYSLKSPKSQKTYDNPVRYLSKIVNACRKVEKAK